MYNSVLSVTSLALRILPLHTEQQYLSATIGRLSKMRVARRGRKSSILLLICCLSGIQQVCIRHTHRLTHTCISSHMRDHMQVHRENSLREDIMTCGPTDVEMTVNSTAKKNDALQTLYPKSHGSLPIQLYTHRETGLLASHSKQ